MSFPLVRSAVALALALATTSLSSCTSYYHVSCDYRPPPAILTDDGSAPLALTLDPILDSRPDITSSTHPPHYLGTLTDSEPILTDRNEPLAAAFQRALTAELLSLGFSTDPTPDSLRLSLQILDYSLDPNTSPTLRARITISLLTPSGTTLHAHTLGYTANIYAHRYYGAWPALDSIHADIFSDLVQTLVRRNEPLRAAIAAFGSRPR